jgi:tetratricopeptide (TPR) repeat protein
VGGPPLKYLADTHVWVPLARDDGALAQTILGRAVQMSGNAGAALPHLEQACQRFERLDQPRMVGASLAEKANCLTALGRYHEAAEAYQRSIAMAEQRKDARSVAVDKGRLATVRLFQRKFSEALRLYGEVRECVERLNEPASVATIWHQIGMVYETAGRYELAEQAYQKSLNIEVRIGDSVKQAATLGRRGNLHSRTGRPEEAVRLYRQAAGIHVATRDLRSEGIDRGSIARELTGLRRFDEARVEIRRAIECLRPFGDAAEPWRAFGILSSIERAVGNETAALAARKQALDAYLAYRRDGGVPQIDVSAIPPGLDPADPEVNYAVAAEILLALGESASAP